MKMKSIKKLLLSILVVFIIISTYSSTFMFNVSAASITGGVDLLEECGCERMFQDKITGMKMDRPELNKMFDMLRSGDTVIVTELSRFGRSVKDLLLLSDILDKKGVNLKSLKEPWADTTTPQGRMLFVIFAGISQFERDLISQRTKEGQASARARGRKGGRPFKEKTAVTLALKMYDSKDYSISEITKSTGVSKSTLYRYMKDYK
jgi:DNA invertase Pin-like site-specific DNA recombinase